MFNRLQTILSKVLHPLKTRTAVLRKHGKGFRIADAVFIITMLFAALSLLALLWYNVRPIKTVDIKVPVATDRSAYSPGETIGGIFFGEIFYKGDVRVLREVYCKDYKAVIPPPPQARNGDFYDTQSIPRKLDGLSVEVGKLPDNIPIGKNCILQFTNVYDIPTPFGTRHISYSYYTQNFAIISKERRQILECEAQGRNNCENEVAPEGTEGFLPSEPVTSPSATLHSPESPLSNEAPQTAQKPAETAQAPENGQRASQAPEQQETPRNEPVTPPRQCTIDVLFIHLFCQ